MNPTVPELLIGSLVAMSEPPEAEATGDFAAGRMGVLGLISFLCAQEAETGAAVRHAENDAIRALFAVAAREEWARELAGELRPLAEGQDRDFTLTGLDAANADLRRVLIRLQMVVEQSGHPDRERRILALLLEHARARSLKLPGQL